MFKWLHQIGEKEICERWDFSFFEKEIDQSRSKSGVRSWRDCNKGLTRKGSENSGVVMEFLAPRAMMKIGALLKETRLGREQIKLRQVSLSIREWSDHASEASFSRLDRVFEEASMQTHPELFNAFQRVNLLSLEHVEKLGFCRKT